SLALGSSLSLATMGMASLTRISTSAAASVASCAVMGLGFSAATTWPASMANSKDEARRYLGMGRSYSTAPSGSWEALSLRPRQQFDQVCLPVDRPGVRAMAVRVGRLGHQPEAGVGHALHRLLRIGEVARIDEIVRGVDPRQRRSDLLQICPGVVIPGG